MVEPIARDELAAALGLGSHELVSFVGGGGKTTGLFALGAQLAGTVVLTTTTKMGRDRTDGHHLLIAPTDVELSDALRGSRTVLAWRADAGHKAIGVAPEVCDRWFDLADHVIVEADGSRQRPFTAPNPFEPVVPSRTTLLVACVGAGAFGRVIADRCHRPMRVAGVAGCSPYERLTPERLATVLSNDRGGRKGCPRHARFVVVLNQVRPSDHGFVDELVDAIDGTVVVVAAS
ncbi:selenium cofactor biosynthesis protein YqeC [Ilumatobacter sp.]|uniref:selenium cofactor biosynthesis protein YqeC n=1 Tax=Ilumatobacter sp. TaxID=1967498 RepID=UPI003AF4E572